MGLRTDVAEYDSQRPDHETSTRGIRSFRFSRRNRHDAVSRTGIVHGIPMQLLPHTGSDSESTNCMVRPSRYGNPTSGSGTRFQIGNLFWRTYVQSLGRSSKISLGRRHRTKNEVLARPMCVHFCLLPRTAIANSTHCLSSIPSWRIVALGAQPTNLCANMLRRGKSCT